MIDLTPDGKYDRARNFAKEAHGDQKYGSAPYVVHLDDVVSVLIRYYVHVDVMGVATDPNLLVAAYLHDVLEDTEITRHQLESEFGADVSTLVDAVTRGRSSTRRMRNKGSYSKIRAVGERAVALKLADRIANVEHCWQMRDRRLFMYYAEQSQLRTELRFGGARGRLDPDESERIGRMWTKLEALLGRPTS